MRSKVHLFFTVSMIAAFIVSACGSFGGQQIDPTLVALAIAATQSAQQQSSAPAIDTTKVVLEIAATNMAAENTQESVSATQSAMQSTQVAIEQTQQALNAPQATPEPPVIAEAPAEGPVAIDYDEKIKNAKILVYEDTQDIGLWVTDALDGMGVEYVHVGDAIGLFMENLNSPIEWDLIIVASESRSKVQGEFWDAIIERMVKNDTAVIAEVWYLDSLGGGRISNFLNKCGVSYQSDYDEAESIYWLQPDHPLFSDPNTAMPLLHYSRYWGANAGDYVRLSAGGDAEILAGRFQKQKSDYGLITSCMEGRVILQTFCNHDYHKDEIMSLWQNYVTYTLKNYFDKIAE